VPALAGVGVAPRGVEAAPAVVAGDDGMGGFTLRVRSLEVPLVRPANEVCDAALRRVSVIVASIERAMTRNELSWDQ
jgi:hypothetical protein